MTTYEILKDHRTGELVADEVTRQQQHYPGLNPTHVRNLEAESKEQALEVFRASYADRTWYRQHRGRYHATRPDPWDLAAVCGADINRAHYYLRTGDPLPDNCCKHCLRAVRKEQP